MITYEQEESALVFAVRVQPGARRSELAGEHAGALKVSVAAPPEKGKANKALIRLLAERFGVGRSDVTIVRGEHSRRKVVRVAGATPGDLQALVERRSTVG